jgi:hypothetical protein
LISEIAISRSSGCSPNNSVVAEIGIGLHSTCGVSLAVEMIGK